MTHGFFIIMGGFHLFERSSRGMSNRNQNISREDDKPLHPLQEKDLQKCDGYSELFYIPTKLEIKDRGKSNWLAKSLVLLQTSWFVMQCIARAIEHLPVTHLEIVTLAYAAMNFVIYIFWWNKPLNVNQPEPVQVFKKFESRETQPPVNKLVWSVRKLTWKAIGKGLKRILTLIIGGQEDEDIDLSCKDRVPRFWGDTTGEDVIISNVIMLGVGVCFGVIHCIAWHFSSPTHTELLMWRISSVAITVLPIYIPLMIVFGGLLGTLIDSEKFVITVVYFVPLSAGLLYILARAVTLVLAFTSLRDLPPGAYETVHWTTFIPHV